MKKATIIISAIFPSLGIFIWFKIAFRLFPMEKELSRIFEMHFDVMIICTILCVIALFLLWKKCIKSALTISIIADALLAISSIISVLLITLNLK